MAHRNLYNGLTFEDMMHGHSKLRNRVIANVFCQMGLVESWGTGIKKMIDSAHEYGIAEPEFIEMPETFRVNLYRKTLPIQNGGEGLAKGSAKFGESSVKLSALSLNDTQKKIMHMIEGNPQMSAKQIAEKTDVSVRAIEKNIKELREKGALKRVLPYIYHLLIKYI